MELGSFGGDSRGQSEVIGVSLLLGIAVIGTVAIVALGASAVVDTQRQSQFERAEHTMTQFDSQASLVALGQTEDRSVSFDQADGTLRVDSGVGEISVVHSNFDGTDADGNDHPDGNGDDELIYSGTLGAVIYENNDETVAYQGGGVWRKGTGEARMVSPPEFHYRGSTLTLPVVRVTGDSSASGRVTGTVIGGSTVRQYPDSSRTYSDGTVYLNPQEHGQVYINVTSEYYEGWADYFRQRTEGDVTVYPDQNRVKVKLISTGVTGPFQMPGEGGSLTVRGVEDHSMSDFSIRLRPDDADSADFANLQWSMYVEDGDEQFELHLRQSTGKTCDNVKVKAVVYYSPPDGDADTDDPYHGWKNTTAYTGECKDLNGDGDDEVFLDVDFVDNEDGDDGAHDIEAGDPKLEYGALGSDDVIQFGNPNDNTLLSPTFDGHSFSPNWESKTYSSGDEETIDRVINHYFSVLGPGFDLTVDDKNSNTVTEGQSSGVIEYVGGAEFVTYVHITENDIEVKLG